MAGAALRLNLNDLRWRGNILLKVREPRKLLLVFLGPLVSCVRRYKGNNIVSLNRQDIITSSGSFRAHLLLLLLLLLSFGLQASWQSHAVTFGFVSG